eukprot:CAMPEP_0172586556 /NCGR_PEP_ID=MMETSP1068-20121228/5919_1 /TAXON_ID=35684 /ORGANISM="Pseudopedinella elastica, Strain CCMP716" /LENGTH=428 /DNA_ID=CAMNT_0013381407 /DNA_START=131 /DNA_END=1418 /DNA_ORIENTATION=+
MPHAGSCWFELSPRVFLFRATQSTVAELDDLLQSGLLQGKLDGGVGLLVARADALEGFGDQILHTAKPHGPISISSVGIVALACAVGPRPREQLPSGPPPPGRPARHGAAAVRPRPLCGTRSFKKRAVEVVAGQRVFLRDERLEGLHRVLQGEGHPPPRAEEGAHVAQVPPQILPSPGVGGAHRLPEVDDVHGLAVEEEVVLPEVAVAEAAPLPEGPHEEDRLQEELGPPFGGEGGRRHLVQLRRRPPALAEKRHHQHVVGEGDWARAGDPALPEAAEVSVLLFAPEFDELPLGLPPEVDPAVPRVALDILHPIGELREGREEHLDGHLHHGRRVHTPLTALGSPNWASPREAKQAARQAGGSAAAFKGRVLVFGFAPPVKGRPSVAGRVAQAAAQAVAQAGRIKSPPLEPTVARVVTRRRCVTVVLG